MAFVVAEKFSVTFVVIYVQVGLMVVQLDTMRMMPLIIMLLGKTSMQMAMEFIRF